MGSTRTLSAIRFGPDGNRRGWCGHKHRYEDQAAACCRRLNRSWGHEGEYWQVKVSGHLGTADAPTGYVPL